MGWLVEDRPGHEGYLVAYVPRARNDLSRLRELSYPDECGDEIRRIGVGCECGWRSPVVVSPFGTTYVPHCVSLPERDEARYEEMAVKLWRRHVDECGTCAMDPASLFDLAGAK